MEKIDAEMFAFQNEVRMASLEEIVFLYGLVTSEKCSWVDMIDRVMKLQFDYEHGSKKYEELVEKLDGKDSEQISPRRLRILLNISEGDPDQKLSGQQILDRLFVIGEQQRSKDKDGTEKSTIGESFHGFENDDVQDIKIKEIQWFNLQQSIS